LWTYLVATVLIILLPGPNSMYVLSVAARRGVRSGYRAACGVFLGDAVLMVASAAGVASLLKASPLLFGVIKFAGAGYLTYLGVNLLWAAVQTWRRRAAADEPQPDRPADAGRRERPFRRALVASLCNPKAI